jgi:FAD/FMN-containing dehydrogenase
MVTSAFDRSLFDRSLFDGVFHLPGDPGYESARVDPLFNGRKPDRFPAAILEAASDADVVAGVRLASEHGWKVSVRAGGHSWAAWGVRNHALLIDLSRMREMEMQSEHEGYAIVRVCPAVQGGQELTPFLAQRNYQFTGGHCSTVGIGGFVLQGGQGWNSRAWGWGCENLMAIDVVTADGELIHANETENSDLLWAARGSGPGFFGVVTRMYLKVRPKPPAMAHTTFVFPVELFDEVITWAHMILPTLDSRVEPVIAGVRAPLPDGTPAPGPYMVMHTTCMAESMEAVRELLRPLESCPVLDRAWVVDVCVPTSIVDEGPFMDEQNPRGLRYHTDCVWTDAPAAELVPRLRKMYTTLPTERSFCIWYGWAPQRPLPDMAFSMEGNVYIAVYAMNNDATDDAEIRGWVNDRMTDLAPISKGLYLGDSDFLHRSAKFMTDKNYARVEALRSVWDPSQRFVGYLAPSGAVLNV